MHTKFSRLLPKQTKKLISKVQHAILTDIQQCLAEYCYLVFDKIDYNEDNVIAGEGDSKLETSVKAFGPMLGVFFVF